MRKMDTRQLPDGCLVEQKMECRRLGAKLIGALEPNAREVCCRGMLASLECVGEGAGAGGPYRIALRPSWSWSDRPPRGRCESDPVKGEATFSASGGYARLVLKLADDVDSEVTAAGTPVLVIRFKQPIEIPVDAIAEAVRGYDRILARRDPRRHGDPAVAGAPGHRQHHDGGGDGSSSICCPIAGPAHRQAFRRT